MLCDMLTTTFLRLCTPLIKDLLAARCIKLYLLHIETFDRGRILLTREGSSLKQHQCQRDLVSEGVCQIFCRFRVQGSREKKGEKEMGD